MLISYGETTIFLFLLYQYLLHLVSDVLTYLQGVCAGWVRHKTCPWHTHTCCIDGSWVFFTSVIVTFWDIAYLCVWMLPSKTTCSKIFSSPNHKAVLLDLKCNPSGFQREKIYPRIKVESEIIFFACNVKPTSFSGSFVTF